MRELLLILLCTSSIFGCADDAYDVSVDVRSDLEAGVEITEIRTNLLRGAETVRAERIDIGTEVALSDGVRAAELRDVPSGDYVVEVIGQGPGGSLISRGLLGLRANTAISILLSSACVGVVCPAGGPPEATLCVDGHCEVPPCSGDCGQPVTPPYPCPGVVDRVDVLGDGYSAAVGLARKRRPEADVVVVARGDGELFQSTIAAVGLAHHLEAPLLLTASDRLSAPVENHLRAHPPSEVIIFGATATVSGAVEASLRALVPRVSRVGGGGRAATAAEAAMRIGAPEGRAVIVNGGEAHLLDAAIAAAAGAGAGRPLLFVNTAGVPAPTLDAIAALEITAVDVIGDESAISDVLVESLGVTSFTRHRDPDAFQQASVVAMDLVPDAVRAALIPIGTPALAAAAGAYGEPILLIDDRTLPGATSLYLRTSSIDAVHLLGPTSEPEVIERAACDVLAGR